jgi:formylglycine-generating enzyme required for sulfatase activity
MPFVEGTTLKHVIESTGPMPQRQVAEMVKTLALALQEALDRGVIHRDLKPANVMINHRNELVVMDFGLARRMDAADPRLTRTGAMLGTPAYMASEQASGDLKAIGPACDVYSLGMVMYEMLAGKRPFEGSALQVIGQVLHVAPEPPSKSRPDLDPMLDAICLKALAKKPEERFASMAAFAEALGSWLDPPPLQPTPTPTNEQFNTGSGLEFGRKTARPSGIVGRSNRRRPTGKVLAGAASAILLLLGVLLTVGNDQKTVKNVTNDPKVLVVEVDGKRYLIEKEVPDVRKSSPAAPVEHSSTTTKPMIPSHAPSAPRPTVLGEGTRAGEERSDNDLKMVFCWCPKGRFRMGSPPSEPERSSDEGPVEVRLTRGFWMGKYEVTQGQWLKVMGTSLAEKHTKARDAGMLFTNIVGEGPTHPMYLVSHTEAEDFCRKLTAAECAAGRLPGLPVGWEYRLPLEAQWEYACRAGGKGVFGVGPGDRLSGGDANFDGNYPYGGAPKGPYLQTTCPVGRYAPNAWGLHDMHGNVWEWCRDGYDAQLKGGDDPEGPRGASLRVLRGGFWSELGRSCRSAFRGRFVPGGRSSGLGFRVARVRSSGP